MTLTWDGGCEGECQWRSCVAVCQSSGMVTCGGGACGQVLQVVTSGEWGAEAEVHDGHDGDHQ